MYTKSSIKHASVRGAKHNPTLLYRMVRSLANPKCKIDDYVERANIVANTLDGLQNTSAFADRIMPFVPLIGNQACVLEHFIQNGSSIRIAAKYIRSFVMMNATELEALYAMQRWIQACYDNLGALENFSEAQYYWVCEKFSSELRQQHTERILDEAFGATAATIYAITGNLELAVGSKAERVFMVDRAVSCAVDIELRRLACERYPEFDYSLKSLLRSQIAHIESHTVRGGMFAETRSNKFLTRLNLWRKLAK